MQVCRWWPGLQRLAWPELTVESNNNAINPSCAEPCRVVPHRATRRHLDQSKDFIS